MNDNAMKERQLAATLEAAAELNAGQTDLVQRLSEPPKPGDVFLSRCTAGYPVEWLMIEEAAGGRARLVPVDEHPYAGSRDLELASGALGGTGVVRCDLDAWIDASELEPELRTGALSELDLGRVRRKRRAIEEETLEASLLEEVVDGDPEYDRWRTDTLRPALDILVGRLGREGADRGAGHRRRCWLPVAAAAALLALALPLGWQVDRLSRQLDQQHGRVAALEDERRALEGRLASAEAERQGAGREVGRLGQALADAAEASKRALAEQQERFDVRLRSAFDRSAVVNVPSFVLGKLARTRSIRGQPEMIDPDGARRFTLSLEVPNPEPYPKYRLRVVSKAGGKEIWRTDDLVKVSGKWLRLDLPADLFAAGEYELLIYGLKSGEPTLLDERYAVKLGR